MTNLDAKVSALINASEGPTADSGPDKGAGAPPSGNASGSESAVGGLESAAGGNPAAPGSPAAPSMADVFAEKLAKTREARQAQRLASTASRDAHEAARVRQEAAADREAAAAERKQWEELKSGNILETLKRAGRDPAEVFAQMQREAIESGTPEAQLRRMREEMDRQLADTVEPLRKTIEQLTAEKARAEMQSAEQGFASDFGGAIEDPSFEDLRIEYPDDRLLQHAKNFRDNPKFFYDVAKQHQVRLTDPTQGFNMRDILNVLKSVQDAHRAGTESRRAARAPAPSEAAPSAASPTVNGTAERRNAEATTIGNDLTTARAADGKFVPQGSTAAQRLRERTRRMSR